MNTNPVNLTCAADSEPPLHAVEVAEMLRHHSLYKHFGMRCTRVEGAVFAMLSALSADYQGGLWTFYELSNGGFYMAPRVPGSFRVQCDGNGYDGVLSADAAGIVACLMALSQLSFHVNDELVVVGFHLLRDFALEHAETAEIFRAID